MPSLSKIIADRLRAGALVLVVQEADELLALSAVEAGAAGCSPVKVLSGADDNAAGAVEELPTEEGTLVLSDYLSIYGENPVAVRLLRQVALQQRDDGERYSRLILIERPETPIPPALTGDVEIIAPALPSVEELQEELEAFLEGQPEARPEGNGETLYAIAAAGAGLARHEFCRLLARSVIEQGSLDVAWIRQEKARRVAVKLGGALTFEDANSAPIGGLDNLRAWLEQRRKAFGSVKARDFGLPAPKGVLVVGVPGGGKSLTAKQTAQTWQLPLLRLDPGRLFGSLVGQSESQARQAIEAAEACAPCILWVDEIEKGLAGGSGGSSTDGGTTQRVFGTILTWLQEKDSDVFVVATANRVDALPPELLRKGRFDDIFTVGLPNATERETIAKIHLERRKRDLGAKAAPAIAKATEGYVGAEIEQAVIDGLFAAYAEGRDLETTDVLAAVKATTPLSKTAPEDIKRIEAWAQGRARPASAPETTKTTTKKKRRRGPALGSK
jgi:hypothetical protein